jgi:catechol 2,3-dioxygenase-like lactoylglutathione lyase family enzyme
MKKMIENINHITLAVEDIERSFPFYRDVLGLKPIAKWRNGAYLNAGDTWFALNQDSRVSKAMHGDYSHIAFTCSQTDFDTLKKKILDFGSIEWSENTSEGDSFYFTDPDGHHLEIHVGNMDSRLADMHKTPRDDIEYY